MPEQGRHGAVAAQRGAIDLDERSFRLVARLLEFEDAPRELRFAGAGRPRQQQRRLRADGDLLDAIDHAVEGGIARGDAGFQELRRLDRLGLEARGDAVVARQIEIDDRVAAGLAALPAPRRRELQQPARDHARLGQQEPADLRDVRAGGDVDEIVLVVGIEGVGAREVVHAPRRPPRSPRGLSSP